MMGRAIDRGAIERHFSAVATAALSKGFREGMDAACGLALSLIEAGIPPQQALQTIRESTTVEIEEIDE